MWLTAYLILANVSHSFARMRRIAPQIRDVGPGSARLDEGVARGIAAGSMADKRFARVSPRHALVQLTKARAAQLTRVPFIVLIVSFLDLNPRLQTGGGFSHFCELRHRESHCFSPSLSHRPDYEVSLQGAGGSLPGSDTNDHSALWQQQHDEEQLPSLATAGEYSEGGLVLEQ